LYIKTKTTARYFTFYINKGVERVYLYAIAGGDTSLGIVLDSFLAYTTNQSAPYPADDTPYVAPALLLLSNIVDQFSDGYAEKFELVPLFLDEISDDHDNTQFVGDGTSQHPNLYDRDVFAFLPFQVNQDKYVIPYYVMTRDVMVDLTPESFNLTISGIPDFSSTTVSGYDPIKDAQVPVSIVSRKGPQLVVTVIATDYPYLLNIFV